MQHWNKWPTAKQQTATKSSSFFILCTHLRMCKRQKIRYPTASQTFLLLENAMQHCHWINLTHNTTTEMEFHILANWAGFELSMTLLKIFHSLKLFFKKKNPAFVFNCSTCIMPIGGKEKENKMVRTYCTPHKNHVGGKNFTTHQLVGVLCPVTTHQHLQNIQSLSAIPITNSKCLSLKLDKHYYC